MATTLEPVNTTDPVNASQTHSPAAGSIPGYHPFRVREYKSEAEMKASYLAIHRRLFPPIRRVDIAQNEAPQVVEVRYIEPDPTPPSPPPQPLPSNPHSWNEFEEPTVTLRDIKVVVLRESGLTHEMLVSQRRNRRIVWPRQTAMWLAKELTTLSLVAIGRYLGHRDHTTVIHACAQVDQRRLKEPDLYHKLMEAVRTEALERQRAEKVV